MELQGSALGQAGLDGGLRPLRTAFGIEERWGKEESCSSPSPVSQSISVMGAKLTPTAAFARSMLSRRAYFEEIRTLFTGEHQL